MAHERAGSAARLWKPNCIQATLARHGIERSSVVRTDLVSSLRLRGLVDLLLFNPPYVVTPPEEMEGCGISISWAGGRDGRQVIDRFLPQVSLPLNERTT